MENSEFATQLPNLGGLIGMHTDVEAAKSEAPLGFLRWAGITTLAGVCGRQVYTKLLGPRGRVMYPNLFTLLIGRAGLGKTTSIDSAIDQMAALKIRFSPDSITSSKFVTWASQASLKNMEMGTDPGIMVALPNLDSLFNKRSPQELKSFMCAAYDCSDRYLKGTQKRDMESVNKMCMNLIAGGTPMHLSSCFQPTDWGEGLASRFIIVHENEDRIGNVPEWKDQLALDYAGGIKSLRDSLKGQPLEVVWTEEAWRAREAWRIALRHELPPHPHAAGYWARRSVNASKLAMLLAVSHGTSTISLAEWDAALAELAYVEQSLPDAFFHTGGNPHAAVMSSVVEWVKKANREVDEHEVRAKLLPYVAPQHLQQLLDSILTSHQLIGDGASPTRKIHHPEYSPSKNAIAGVTTWAQAMERKKQLALKASSGSSLDTSSSPVQTAPTAS